MAAPRDIVCASLLVGGTAAALYHYFNRGPVVVQSTRNKAPSEANPVVLLKELDVLRTQFDHNQDTLSYIRNALLKEMEEGLESHASSSALKMIPTFITQLPNGSERGTALALDIGGSNLRVLKILLNGTGSIEQAEEPVKLEIPLSVQQGTGQGLFDFIADAVKRMTKQDNVSLGFTFSFPVDQTSVNSGTLIKWTKNFSATEVVDKDVVALLHDSFTRKGMNVEVNAMINDTVGTLLAGCYQSGAYDCCIGMILGTGMNTCYVDNTVNIKKLAVRDSDIMIVNMESGNFGSRAGKIGDHLPLTEYDNIVNNGSINKNNQMLEKQVSGMYLGEILRQILRKQMEKGNLFKDYADKITTPYTGLTTSDMSTFLEDTSTDLIQIKAILAGYGVLFSTLDERKFVKEAAYLVARRAAKLAATLVASVLRHLNKEDKNDVVVAIDGSLFEKSPKFDETMQETLYLLLQHRKVSLRLAKDGSGVGAALASYKILHPEPTLKQEVF